MTELCTTCGQPGTELHPLRPWRWGLGHADLNACVAALRDRVEELENAQPTVAGSPDATALQNLTMDRVVALEAKLEELTENLAESTQESFAELQERVNELTDSLGAALERIDRIKIPRRRSTDV